MRSLSYRSPKTEVRQSPIHGKGMFAIADIKNGEVVCVKGGYIVDGTTRREINSRLGPVEIQIDDDLFIAPFSAEEREGGMLYLNHSCDASAGLRGDITFIAMRDIATGEEVTHDWCMTDDDDYELPCYCGSAKCRGMLTGKDWGRKELQQQYRGYFSPYLARKIGATVCFN